MLRDELKSDKLVPLSTKEIFNRNSFRFIGGIVLCGIFIYLGFDAKGEFHWFSVFIGLLVMFFWWGQLIQELQFGVVRCTCCGQTKSVLEIAWAAKKKQCGGCHTLVDPTASKNDSTGSS